MLFETITALHVCVARWDFPDRDIEEVRDAPSK